MSIQRDSATGRISVRTEDNRDLALADASAAYPDVAARAEDDGDRLQLRALVADLLADATTLEADAARLRDTTVALTTAQLRAHLARTDDAAARLARGQARIIRYLARRGL